MNPARQAATLESQAGRISQVCQQLGSLVERFGYAMEIFEKRLAELPLAAPQSHAGAIILHQQGGRPGVSFMTDLNVPAHESPVRLLRQLEEETESNLDDDEDEAELYRSSEETEDVKIVALGGLATDSFGRPRYVLLAPTPMKCCVVPLTF